MMRLLRRVTTVMAIDVVTPFEEPARRVSSPLPVALPESMASPPAYEPGICWHDVHVEFDGVRYGVTPTTRDGKGLLSWAALTRCHHRSPGTAVEVA